MLLLRQLAGLIAAVMHLFLGNCIHTYTHTSMHVQTHTQACTCRDTRTPHPLTHTHTHTQAGAVYTGELTYEVSAVRGMQRRVKELRHRCEFPKVGTLQALSMDSLCITTHATTCANKSLFALQHTRITSHSYYKSCALHVTLCIMTHATTCANKYKHIRTHARIHTVGWTMLAHTLLQVPTLVTRCPDCVL
jgi:hypothetical protein